MDKTKEKKGMSDELALVLFFGNFVAWLFVISPLLAVYFNESGKNSFLALQISYFGYLLAGHYALRDEPRGNKKVFWWLFITFLLTIFHCIYFELLHLF